MDVGNGGFLGGRERLHRDEVRTVATREEGLEGRLDVDLHGARGQVQNPDVLDVCALAPRIDEGVVGAAKHERRKELLAKAVPRKRAPGFRTSDQITWR